MEELPDWPDGTVAVLATAGDAPHAIPVSLVVRCGPREMVIGLAPRRESLSRLREDPRCAVTLLAAGDHAVTAHGRAVEFGDANGIVAVRVAVDRIADHNRPTYEIDAGVAWHWTDDAERERDAATRAALKGLALERPV
jgi:hypothetical protein